MLQIEHLDRYGLQCSTLTGYNSTENRDLRVGTPVYIRSSNEKNSTDGLITMVSGQNFLVAVRGGDLEFGKDVKVYREMDYAEKSLLAHAKPSVIPPRTVAARGTVVRMAVSRGDEVKQGDLLFTFSPEMPAPEDRSDIGVIRAEEDLVIAGVHASPGSYVQQKQPLAIAWGANDMRLTAQVEEAELARVHPGLQVSVMFEELALELINGVVTDVASLGTGMGTVCFAVHIDFDAPEQARFGMQATVSIP